LARSLKRIVKRGGQPTLAASSFWSPATVGEELVCQVSVAADDSQIDSKIGGLLRTSAHDRGISELAFQLLRTLMDGYGRKTRGLQNRLRSFVDVRSSSSLSTDLNPVGR
jgi:hypothetical protein